MRTRDGVQSAVSATSNPASVDYSELAARTLSVEPRYDVIVVQGVTIGRSVKQPPVKFTVLHPLHGVEVQTVKEKFGKSTKLKWNEFAKLVGYTNNSAKRDARWSQQQMVVGSSTEATALKSKQENAIAAAFGLLKNKNVLPLDALQFERDMRDE